MTETDLQLAGIIAIIRSKAEIDLLAATQALHRGGIRAMEITLNTPGAIDAIARLREYFQQTMWIGAGTILCAADARTAISAGAQYIVTPTFQPDTIALCRRLAVPICCGCFSPTEMLQAHTLGAHFIKVFPATLMGVTGIRAICDVLPQLQLVPTGGVNAHNLGEFILAGCPAVALGSAMVQPQLLLNRDWKGLEVAARQCSEALNTARAARNSPQKRNRSDE